jgi:hypothetical protein
MRVSPFGVWYSTQSALLLMCFSLLVKKPWLMLVGVMILGVIGPAMARRRARQEARH